MILLWNPAEAAQVQRESSQKKGLWIVIDALDLHTIALLPSQQEEEKLVMGSSNFHALILVN